MAAGESFAASFAASFVSERNSGQECISRRALAAGMPCAAGPCGPLSHYPRIVTLRVRGGKNYPTCTQRCTGEARRRVAAMSRRAVSIVIPAHNAAGTIDAALASVAGQSWPADEVIVVDDASTDDTVRRAASWRGRLPLTILTNGQNLGCGASRKRAVLAASGDLVAPLDADDVLLPDHLATVVPLVADERTIVAVGRRRWMPGVALAAPGRSGSCIPPGGQQVVHILRGNFLFAGSVVHRNALLAIGGGSEMRRADDWETWIRLIVEGGCRVVASPGETVLYRTDPRSLSAADRCLPDEIALCTRLRQEPPYRPHLRTLDASIRRREARLLLLEGLRQADAGDAGRARRLFATAIVTDRSLRGGTTPAPLGSVTLRAACALASPTLARRTRDRRLATDALADPLTRPGTNGAG